MENKMEVAQEPKHRTIIWSSDSASGHIYEKKNENTNLKRFMHPNIYSSIIYNSQDMKTHTHTLEYYSAIKKNENLPTTWMDLDYIMPSEISQMEKNK